MSYFWDSKWDWVESAVFIINDVIVDDSDTTPWPFKTWGLGDECVTPLAEGPENRRLEIRMRSDIGVASI